MNPKILNAPYNTKLAKSAGWKNIVKGLNIVFHDQPALKDDDLTFYVNFGFMNNMPQSIGVDVDPDVGYSRTHMGADVDIFQIVRDAKKDGLSDEPFHEALFRYKKSEGWAAATLYDEQVNKWDVWRDRRAELDRLRLNWFSNDANPSGFDHVQKFTIEILFDAQYGGYELVPLLVGWSGDDVWMLTSFFTNPPSPREANHGDDLKYTTELLFRCAGANLEKDQTVLTSPEFQAINLMAEAFYWKYIEPVDAPSVDLSKPQRLHTLDKHTGKAQSLAPSTPFVLSPATSKPIDLKQGLKMTPAFVTVEGSLSGSLNPSLSAKLLSWTGSLGKAPKKYVKPVETDLLTQLRVEIHEHDEVTSIPLTQRMERLAALEFYYGRALPPDIAPNVRGLYLLELGESNWSAHHRLVKKAGDLDAERHGDFPGNTPTLEKLCVYTGLRKLDLRMSDVENLDWLAALHWIETLFLSNTQVTDFSRVADAPNLTSLDLANTSINDLSALTQLNKLEDLSLHASPATDLTPLTALSQLTKLSIPGMKVDDLSVLAPLNNLRELGLEGHTISDLSFLKAFSKLRWLSLAATDIEDLSLLPALPQLEELYLHNANNVTDLSPLAKFKNLSVINATGTRVQDWSPVEFVGKVLGRP